VNGETIFAPFFMFEVSYQATKLIIGIHRDGRSFGAGLQLSSLMEAHQGGVRQSISPRSFVLIFHYAILH
jgi:hypothetical protein